MAKSKMATEYETHASLEATIDTMVKNRDFPAVFSTCVQSFPYVVSAVKYHKQNGVGAEMPDPTSFVTIWRYAPPLFEHVVLESLAAFVDSTRLLAKHENDYPEIIAAAFEREELARRLWDFVAQHTGVLQHEMCQELSIEEQAAIVIMRVWEELGVIVRQQEQRSFRLFLRTRLDEEVTGLCPACGVRAKGRKELFFKATSCQKCGTAGHYHIQYPDLL